MPLSTVNIIAQPRLHAGGAPVSSRCLTDLKKSPSLQGLFFVRHPARPEESGTWPIRCITSISFQ